MTLQRSTEVLYVEKIPYKSPGDLGVRRSGYMPIEMHFGPPFLYVSIREEQNDDELNYQF